VSCLVQGEVDERGRDGVALLQQDVGELHHGDEVADEEARVRTIVVFTVCVFFPGSICTICSTARGFRGEEEASPMEILGSIVQTRSLASFCIT